MNRTIISIEEAKKEVSKYPNCLIYSLDSVYKWDNTKEIKWAEVLEARFFGCEEGELLIVRKDGELIASKYSGEERDFIEKEYKEYITREYYSFDSDGQIRIDGTRLYKVK